MIESSYVERIRALVAGDDRLRFLFYNDIVFHAIAEQFGRELIPTREEALEQIVIAMGKRNRDLVDDLVARARSAQTFSFIEKSEAAEC